MKKNNDGVSEKPATLVPKENTNEQIPRLLVFGVIALFIIFLITSVALAIWFPKYIWIPLILFLLVFSSTTLIYFFIKIIRSAASKKEEDIKALQKNEAELLELVRTRVSNTISKQSEGHNG